LPEQLRILILGDFLNIRNAGSVHVDGNIKLRNRAIEDMVMAAEPVENISVIGLGKLGACIAAVLASRAFKVIGYDLDQWKINHLRNGLAPTEEPWLQERIELAGSRLIATDDIRQAVHETDASFFVLPTPSLANGSFSNDLLIAAIQSVAKIVRQERKQRHLFIVSSTITPGTCDQVLEPLLKRLLGDSATKFGLCYNPQFIALGNVVQGLLQPDLVLIGESEPSSGELVSQIQKRLTTNSPPVERMSNLNAELTKVALNCAVTMKISFANQISGVCAKMPGSNPELILRAIGKDRRIAPDYLKLGLGFGGPCFPRDNRLFQFVAQSVGAEAPLSNATDRINDDVSCRLFETVVRYCPPGTSVGVLGLAYKPFTDVIDESAGIWLCRRLADAGRKVFAHDYLATKNAFAALEEGSVQICNDPADILSEACQTIVITCPWPEYKDLFNANMHQFSGTRTTIVDPWHLLESIVDQDVHYVTALTAIKSAVSPIVAAHA
jgi:UDPglucose 6-dehydrogenase